MSSSKQTNTKMPAAEKSRPKPHDAKGSDFVPGEDDMEEEHPKHPPSPSGPRR